MKKTKVPPSEPSRPFDEAKPGVDEQLLLLYIAKERMRRCLYGFESDEERLRRERYERLARERIEAEDKKKNGTTPRQAMEAMPQHANILRIDRTAAYVARSANSRSINAAK